MSRNQKTIVAPYEVFNYTQENIVELNRCRKDPIYFITNYCQVQHPIKGIIPLKLYDYQKRMITSYQENRYSIVLSARQTGKALPLDTIVPTPIGWTTMGIIKPGDMILGSDGKPTTVKFVTDVMHDRVCYNIKFDNNENITADADHEWVVYNNKTKLNETLTTQQLVDNTEKVQYRIAITKSLVLDQANLEVDPYTLGAWLGDGTSSRGVLTAHRNDLAIVDYIQEAGFDIKTRFYKQNDVSTTTIYKLSTKLRSIGVLNNKHIPIEYLRASHEQRLALLQGLMDTDGYVNVNGGCEIALSSKILIDGVYELICSLGLKPTMTSRPTTHKRSYRVFFKAFKNITPVFRLPRKLNRLRYTPSNISTQYRIIKSISTTESVPVRCLTVDNVDSTFLVGKAMIPTHNSTVSSAYLYWFAAFHVGKTVLIVANKEDLAKEMVSRIRLMYEMTPGWLKPGITADGWNKHSVHFDNRSRILSEATSSDSGRGYPVSMLYCLGGNTTVSVKHKETGEITTVELTELYDDLIPDCIATFDSLYT